jgi:carbonic anhydrase
MKKVIATAALFATMFTANAAFANAENDAVLGELLAGNATFAASGDVSKLEEASSVLNRQTIAGGQHPKAIILACADSRLSPEIIFNKGLGEVFVVRVAGNIVAQHEIGSIEYGIEHLGAKLVMVLGHTNCGAVKATYDAAAANTARPGVVPRAAMQGNIGSLIKDISPAVNESYRDGLNACIVTNVENVVKEMEENSTIIKEGVEIGEVKIVAAEYDLMSGLVSVLPEHHEEGHSH